MRVEAFYIIRQAKRKIRTKQNHFTDHMVQEWMRCISNYFTGPTKHYGGAAIKYVIGFGKNTTTPTGPTLASLADPVSYKPDTQTFIGFVKEADGVWVCKYGATWNANHFPENKTLGEIGIHFDANLPAIETDAPTDANRDNFPVRTWNGTKLASRCSVADGDFTAITVDCTLPLTIEYWIRLKAV